MLDIMSQTPLWIWWLILAILLLVFEIFLPSLLLIWFAIGAAVALGVALIPSAGLGIQLAVFGLASLVGLLIARPYIKARNDAGEEGRELNDFTANLVGASGILTQAIEGGKGRARIGDTTWTVTGPDLPVKTRIRVTSVDGIRLGVKADDAF